MEVHGSTIGATQKQRDGLHVPVKCTGLPAEPSRGAGFEKVGPAEDRNSYGGKHSDPVLLLIICSRPELKCKNQRADGKGR